MEPVLIDILQTQPDSFLTREQKTAGVFSSVASSWPRLAGLMLTECVCGCVCVCAPTELYRALSKIFVFFYRSMSEM